MAHRTKGASRTRERARLLDLAAEVSLPRHVDVCVLGGGAAGLVAATVAAERGAHVVVLERDLECGRTILATGNGRCNFANVHLDTVLYNDPAFVAAVCGVRWLEDVLAFFEACGLAWAEEAEGRLYPLSRQAASVRNVLLCRAIQAGVILAPAREATHVRRVNGEFVVTLHESWEGGCERTLRTASVILATGGGQTKLYEDVGIRATPSSPLLCPLACEHPLLNTLDGRRVRARATLVRAGTQIACEQGEVLFRPYGLSGIVVFNLSRHAQSGDTVRLNLLPTLDPQKARELAHTTLDGVLDPIVAQALMKHAHSHRAALDLACNMEFTVCGFAETDHAQVRRGGLATTEFLPTTLEAEHVRHLHACGEALDVDGPCGGFNLAWAWKSGMVAGAAAATRITT